jgi:cyclomaltodextrinase
MSTPKESLKTISIYVGLILFPIFLSCQSEKNNSIDDPICGLASPILLNSDTTVLHLSDYFVDASKITGIIFPENMQALKLDSLTYKLIRKIELPALSSIQFKTDKNRYSILVKNNARVKVTIQFQLKGKIVKSVKVRGSLNFWNASLSKMKQEDSIWMETFELSPGEYQYLLVVDGKEIRDPSNIDSINNNMGGYNSLLKVGQYKQEDLPFIKTVSFTDAEINLKGNIKLTGIYGFWQNEAIKVVTEGNSISLKIPQKAKMLKRSFIRAIGFNAQGISNDILIPLEYGKVIVDASKLTRSDRQTMIMYFMMVDRFNNGEKSNDHPVKDPQISPKVNYFGGDIAGIILKEKEGYFKDLGVNTLWLSPISQNPIKAYGRYPKPFTTFSGYHGYWPVSSTTIDYRFGTENEFKDLIKVAHDENMNVLLDYVAHHVHELHPVYKLHPDWVTDLYLPDGTLNTEKWDEYRLTTWFDTFLPTLDTRRPEVVNPMTDSALFWVTHYGIDGFRHDATKHVDELFWRTLTKKLKLATNCSPMIYQIGETYGSHELIGSYISTGMLDAQFDFNVYDDAVAVFSRSSEPFERLKNSLNESLRFYGYHNLMGYITGNQDRPRFISYAGGALSFTEDTKLAGWTRNVGVGDSIAYDKLKMLHVFDLTIPGIPVIYYGDEIGMPGANDPDNRRMMKFDQLTVMETDVKQVVQYLNHLRMNSMPLLFGDLQFLESNNNTMAFMRTYFDQIDLVVFNKGDKFETVKLAEPDFMNKTLDAHFNQKISMNNDTLVIDLKPNSFDIISIKNK